MRVNNKTWPSLLKISLLPLTAKYTPVRLANRPPLKLFSKHVYGIRHFFGIKACPRKYKAIGSHQKRHSCGRRLTKRGFSTWSSISGNGIAALWSIPKKETSLTPSTPRNFVLYWIINSLRDQTIEGKLIWSRYIQAPKNQRLATQKQNQLSKKRCSIWGKRVPLIISMINFPCPLSLQYSRQSWLRCSKAYGFRKLPHRPETILLIEPTMQVPMHEIKTVAHCFIAAFIATIVIKKAITLQAALGQQ